MKGKMPKKKKSVAAATEAAAKSSPASPMSGPTKKSAAAMSVEGPMPKRRLDRPGRKTGGRIGADMAPLSSAARTTDRSDAGSSC